jgi:predicted DNA-binding transcriptional regulator YafY
LGPALVRTLPHVVPRLRELRFTQVQDVSAPDEDGWVTVAVQWETIHEASEYVLGFGPQIEVLEPQKLRQRVIELLERTTALYSPNRE